MSGAGAAERNDVVSIRALIAAIAVIAIPIAVNGQQPPRESQERSEKKICEVHLATGSRLERVRRCMSRREREEYSKEIDTDLTRQQLDRRQ
jgi:hypothetical protein